MSVNTRYDPDVGRPKKRPEDRVRTPARSFKPPPELYAQAQRKIADIRRRQAGAGVKPGDRLTMRDVLVRALEDFVEGKWKP